jgi:excisionase family DNA binding protein
VSARITLLAPAAQERIPILLRDLRTLVDELEELVGSSEGGLADLSPASNGRARPAPTRAECAANSMDPDFQPTTATLPALGPGKPRPASAAAPEELLTMQDVADLLRVHPRTLRAWRHAGQAPPTVLVGSRPRCRREDVEAWLAERRGR